MIERLKQRLKLLKEIMKAMDKGLTIEQVKKLFKTKSDFEKTKERFDPER